jgi:hypothetical protein
MDVYRQKTRFTIYIQNSGIEFGILNYHHNIQYQHRNVVPLPNPLTTSLGVLTRDRTAVRYRLFYCQVFT